MATSPLSVPVTWTAADGPRPAWAKLLAPARDTSLAAAVAVLVLMTVVVLSALARNVADRSAVGIGFNLLFLGYVVVGYARRVLAVSRPA